MIYFKQDKESKLGCGINDSGDLFVGDVESCTNFPDTPQNREKILRIFDEEVDRYHRFHDKNYTSPPSFNADTLKELDALVDENVSYYKTDWTEYDRPRVEQCKDSDSFAIMLRDTGVDTVFFEGVEVCYNNLLWGKACAESERSRFCVLYENGEITETTNEALADRCRKTLRSLPDDYVNACEAAQYKHEEMPMLEAWKETSGYNKKKQKREKTFSR